MPLSKEFYLDEIRSKYPNSYNESLKDLEVKELEDMLDFLEGALGKADGGSIGIEVLFGPKRDEYQTGGRIGFNMGGAQFTSGGNISPGTDKRGNVRDDNPFTGGGGGGGPPSIINPSPVIKPPVVTDNFDNRGFLSDVRIKNQKKYLDILNRYKPDDFDIRNRMDGTSNLTEEESEFIDRYGIGKIYDDLSKQNVENFMDIREGIAPKINPSEITSPREYEFAEVTDIDLKRAKEPMTKMMDYDTYKSVNPSSKITPYEFEELKKGNITETGTFTAADGGRVGFFMGGPALEGQALSIYNSMNAYGFTDQQIADALSAQGLYTPSGATQPEQVTGIINQQINQSGDDKPTIRPFREDPRVESAFEAYQRNEGLKALGIEDPFANESTLAGAYYGDMPDVDLKPGSQNFMGKVKSKMDSIISLSPTLNFFKGIGQGIANMLPVNQRAIAENVAGNMGIAVDDIGRVVNTGDYNDPNNVMAGYNLNQMTDETFDKRIDNISETLSNKYGLGVNEIKGILEGTLSEKELADINAKAIMPGTNKTTNLIKQLRSINIMKDKNKFIQETARKEAERKAFEKAKSKQITTAPTQLGGGDGQSGGSYQGGAAFAAANPYGGSGTMADLGADSFYKDGGLATMFTRRR